MGCVYPNATCAVTAAWPPMHWLWDHHNPVGPRKAILSGHQSQGIRVHPSGSSHRSWGTRHRAPREMLASWTMAERAVKTAPASWVSALQPTLTWIEWESALSLDLCLQDYGPPSPEYSPWVCCLSFPIYHAWGCKHTSLWSPESEKTWASPVAASKNRRARKRYKLLREGQAGVRQRRSRERFHQPSLPEGGLQTSRSMSEWNPAGRLLARQREPSSSERSEVCFSLLSDSFISQLLQPHRIQEFQAPPQPPSLEPGNQGVSAGDSWKPGHQMRKPEYHHTQINASLWRYWRS